MKALTVRAPWAHLLVQPGGKDTENRTWPTKYRGLLLVHAGLGTDPAGFVLAERLGIELDEELVQGAIIGSVEVVGCERDVKSPWAQPECWHWQLENPVQFDEPVAATGKLGLWTPPAEVIAQLPRTVVA